MTTRLDKIDIEESLEAETVATERVYVGKDKSNGYFYSDASNRTAFTGGNFYIKTSVPTFYNYAGQTYHGFIGSTDQQQKFTNNTLSGDDWSISGSTGKFTTTGAVSAYSMNAYGVTASVFTEGSTTLANKYLGKSGGTMTGKLIAPSADIEGALNVKQSAHSSGLRIFGHDNRAAYAGNIFVDSLGNFRITQTHGAGSGYLQIHADTYLGIIALIIFHLTLLVT